MYGHVSIHSPAPGRLHRRGRLHGSNVLTCCTWARTRREGVITGCLYVYNSIRLGLYTSEYSPVFPSASGTIVLIRLHIHRYHS